MGWLHLTLRPPCCSELSVLREDSASQQEELMRSLALLQVGCCTLLLLTCLHGIRCCHAAVHCGGNPPHPTTHPFLPPTAYRLPTSVKRTCGARCACLPALHAR